MSILGGGGLLFAGTFFVNMWNESGHARLMANVCKYKILRYRANLKKYQTVSISHM